MIIFFEVNCLYFGDVLLQEDIALLIGMSLLSESPSSV